MTKTFAVNDGTSGVYTLEQMLKANANDEHFCEWAKNAGASDIYQNMGEKCECIEVTE
jgi:hypothetical protein